MVRISITVLKIEDSKVLAMFNPIRKFNLLFSIKSPYSVMPYYA